MSHSEQSDQGVQLCSRRRSWGGGAGSLFLIAKTAVVNLLGLCPDMESG